MRTWEKVSMAMAGAAMLSLGACGADASPAAIGTTVTHAVVATDGATTSVGNPSGSAAARPFFPDDVPADLSLAPMTSGASSDGTADADRYSYYLSDATGRRSVSIAVDRALGATEPGPAAMTLTDIRPGITVRVTEPVPASAPGESVSIVIAWWVEDGFGVRVAMGGLTVDEQRQVIASM